MKGGGSYSKIGSFVLDNPKNPMIETDRSSSGDITTLTYKFLRGKDFLYDASSGPQPQSDDSLVSLSFSLDLSDPTEQKLGGITKVSLKKDGNYYVATITLSTTSTTASSLVDNLPLPTSSTSETYKIVGGTLLNDSLFGSSGNDALIGGDGDDRLKAYGGSKEEVDILTGGFGADTFVLGDRTKGQSDFGGSYQGSGHAIITDFRDYEGDKIQLLKNGNYQLKVEDKHIGSATKDDTTIYYKGDIIAYVQDVQLTSLSPSNFTFV